MHKEAGKKNDRLEQHMFRSFIAQRAASSSSVSFFSRYVAYTLRKIGRRMADCDCRHRTAAGCDVFVAGIIFLMT